MAIRALSGLERYFEDAGSKDRIQKASARGIRNNNPGNIEFGKRTRSWGAKSSDGRFAKFDTPEEGIASIYKLQKQYEVWGQQTVADRIEKWAPKKENGVATKNYINAVAAAMGIDATTPFSIKDPTLGPAFVGAMIQHENGYQPYTTEQIATARTFTDQIPVADQAREMQAQRGRLGAPSGPPPPDAAIASAPPAQIGSPGGLFGPDAREFHQVPESRSVAEIWEGEQKSAQADYQKQLDRLGRLQGQSPPASAPRPVNPLQQPLAMTVPSPGNVPYTRDPSMPTLAESHRRIEDYFEHERGKAFSAMPPSVGPPNPSVAATGMTGQNALSPRPFGAATGLTGSAGLSGPGDPALRPPTPQTPATAYPSAEAIREKQRGMALGALQPPSVQPPSAGAMLRPPTAPTPSSAYPRPTAPPTWPSPTEARSLTAPTMRGIEPRPVSTMAAPMPRSVSTVPFGPPSENIDRTRQLGKLDTVRSVFPNGLQRIDPTLPDLQSTWNAPQIPLGPLTPSLMTGTAAHAGKTEDDLIAPSKVALGPPPPATPTLSGRIWDTVVDGIEDASTAAMEGTKKVGQGLRVLSNPVVRMAMAPGPVRMAEQQSRGNLKAFWEAFEKTNPSQMQRQFASLRASQLFGGGLGPRLPGIVSGGMGGMGGNHGGGNSYGGGYSGYQGGGSRYQGPGSGGYTNRSGGA